MVVTSGLNGACNKQKKKLLLLLQKKIRLFVALQTDVSDERTIFNNDA